MKNISKHIVLLLVLVAIKLQAQTPANIIKKDTTITGTITLTATKSIIIKPNTWIKPGSTFVAKISASQIPDPPIAEGYNPLALSNQNYILSRRFQTPMKTASGIVNNTDVIESITYFDGLGRPMQNIAIRGSGSNQDLITHIEYDGFGRQIKEYLPYASNQKNGAYVDPASLLTDVVTQYQSNYGSVNTNPFSEKSLEASPLSRVLKQAAPGNDWAIESGHEIKLNYQTNTASEVKLYTATTYLTAGLYDITLGNTNGTTYYEPGQLYKTITYDENTTALSESAGATVEFKNKEGQIVLKRTYNDGEKHDTYYVYDSYGNLTYVIPPKADENITTDVLNGLCYQYKYDNKNRLAEKKLPGKQWEFIVYDKLDRPVATGPALCPFTDNNSEGWLITKYDAFGRVIYTGWSSAASNSATRKSLQDAQNVAAVLFETKQTSGSIDGISVYYSNNIAPTSFKLLTVNYYDDYAFPNAQTMPSAIEEQTVLTNTKGLNTGSWIRVLTTTATILSETNTIFYDYKARPMRSFNQNYLQGYTCIDTKLDFSGKALYTIARHKRNTSSTELVMREEFTYSGQNRLLTHTHQINGGIVQLLASNSYDEFGQLTSKNVGNNAASPLQKIDYNYNIRGWLTDINNTSNLQQGTDPKDLFAFKINYNSLETGIAGVKQLYNGNIAETLWKTGSDAINRGYGYKYDNLNRLTNAVYKKEKDISKMYDENLGYDKNGNIVFLTRFGDRDVQIGENIIDNLVYTYPISSNQLSKVDDNSNNTSGFDDYNKTGDDYSYDANGNMITDKNKSITAISYNHLNLPKKIAFGGASSIEYIYNAAGQKLEKIVTSGTCGSVITAYLGGFQYETRQDYCGKPSRSYEGLLLFFPTAEGYVKNDNGVLSYVFQYKDHLGNVRLSYAKNPQTQVLEIIEENNYYPFGLKHKGYNDYLPIANNYKYNGKELQDELNLNVYDYGARNYDPALGRWMNIDPHSENYYSLSPYNSFVNNPISFVDPTGEDILFWQMNEKTGKFEKVAFNKLDKNIQKGIEEFGKTKLGYSFLASFAKKNDKIGSLSFDKDGKYSNHYMYFQEVEGDIDYEGVTKTPTVTKGSIAFQINLNKNMENPAINQAETVGHEVFLHLLQYLDDMVSVFNKGGRGEATMFDIEKSSENPNGYRDHRAVKEDTQGRAKKYFEYISQLKTVLNPNEVQKFVNKEINKTYQLGVDKTPKNKK